jgi:hypothetical protein
VVGATAAALASPIVDPILARLEAAEATASGAAITNDMVGIPSSVHGGLAVPGRHRRVGPKQTVTPIRVCHEVSGKPHFFFFSSLLFFFFSS